MSAIRFAVAFFGLASAVLVGVSLGFVNDNWYEVTFSTTSGSVTQTNKINFGVLKSCANGACDWIRTPSDATFAGACTRKGTLIAARIYSCLGCALLGGLLCVIAIPLSIPNVKGAAVARVVLMAFAAAALGVSAGLFYSTLEQWLFCDKKYCDLNSTLNPCSNKFTLYYWLLVAAGGSAVAGMLVGIMSVVMTPPTVTPADDVPAPASQYAVAPTAEPAPQRAADEELPVRAAEKEGAAEDHASDAAGGAEADDDWAWDEESGMYWSDSAYLYLHAESGMFYDPRTGYWYDPEGEQWFNPDAEEEAAPAKQAA